jgi:hypothetical protein
MITVVEDGNIFNWINSLFMGITMAKFAAQWFRDF